MKYSFTHTDGHGKILLHKQEKDFHQQFYTQEKGFTFHTIAWNTGASQLIYIDEAAYVFERDTVLPIMFNQSFRFERAEDIVAWQFNREFYCIVNHEAEVGCVGFIFFGPSPTMFTRLEPSDTAIYKNLLSVFEEEFSSEEDIKGEMLRMLLVQLIIKTTRLAKKQYLGNTESSEDKFNLIRQFNLQVEIHFREQHQVQFYAGLLNKSPKTISNYFAQYSRKSPLQYIHDRIIMEARRLFYYTDKSVKEIAEELGFEECSHFSKFFKKYTAQNPSRLRSRVAGGDQGKIYQ